MTLWKLLICSFFVCCVFSCSKKDKVVAMPDGNGKGAQPVQRPLGKPTGPAIVKTIGPEGGQLTSADNRFLLNVPPGAVTANTQFSIQPVENTLEGSPGKAFRLQPENVQFTKPVTIRYSIRQEELATTVPEALFLAYQDKNGYHYMATHSDLDLTTRQLSVQTTHFSDWTIAELLELVADTTRVTPNGKANLRLMWHLGSLLSPETAFQPIGDLTDYNGYVSKVNWSLASGKGSIQPNGIKCTYQAPNYVPEENPAFVSVTVPITSYGNKRKAQAMLTAPILIMPDEYLIITVDGQPAINKKTEDGYNWLKMEADKFYISCRLQDDNSIYILIPGSIGPGTYPYGEDEKKASISYSTNVGPLDSWETQKSNCEYCDLVYSEGHVKISRFGNVGDYVEGEFTAEVWLMGEYNPPKKNITGKFRVKRNF